MNSIKRICPTVLGLLLCVILPVHAQTGIVKGKVLDKRTQEPIPFASVMLEKGAIQISGTASDFDGKFKLQNLPSGSFMLRSMAVGYKPCEIDQVVVLIDSVLTYVLELELRTEPLTSNIQTMPVKKIDPDKLPYMPIYKPPPGYHGYILGVEPTFFWPFLFLLGNR